MTKKDEKSIVEIAEGTIEKFVEDWSRTPYAWESEADVHADLYGRICSALVQNRKKFSKQERDNYPFSKYGYEEWGKEKEDFKAVYCKPKVKGVRPTQYPDIVIYKKTTKPVSVDSRENEPMLWVCEVKYLTEWSSQFSRSKIKEDTKKLKHWLEQRVKVYQLILERGKRPESTKGYIRKCFENPENNHGSFLEKLRKKYKIPIHYHFIKYCVQKDINEN